MRKQNFITKSDSYKFGHGPMYSPNTTTVYSYFEARKGAKFEATVFFSLQYILKEYFVGKVITQEMIDSAEKIINIHLGEGAFNKEGWQYILDKYDGKLPLSIKAVPEGTIVDEGNVLFTVENTDPKCYWLTNYVESILSHVWYGSAVATLSKEIKDLILKYRNITSSNPLEGLEYCLHDFGYRSVTCDEQAAYGAGAHQLIFSGTDTLTGIEFLMDYYNADVEAFSVVATEHSIMTSEGKKGEFAVVQRVLNKYPEGIISLVIDSYDYRNFIKVCGTEFKEQILSRDGKFVFRPDSGDPVKTTIEIINMLGEYFGYSYNSKGFKLLNPKIGLLWGDGINMSTLEDVLKALVQDGWCVTNIVFGMGSSLLHSDVKRDTQRCAFKSSYQVAAGVEKNIFKDPIDGSKKSKKGRLALVKRDGKYVTLEEVQQPVEDDLLVEVFRNGELLVEYTSNDIKANLNK